MWRKESLSLRRKTHNKRKAWRAVLTLATASLHRSADPKLGLSLTILSWISPDYVVISQHRRRYFIRSLSAISDIQTLVLVQRWDSSWGWASPWPGWRSPPCLESTCWLGSRCVTGFGVLSRVKLVFLCFRIMWTRQATSWWTSLMALGWCPRYKSFSCYILRTLLNTTLKTYSIIQYMTSIYVYPTSACIHSQKKCIVQLYCNRVLRPWSSGSIRILPLRPSPPKPPHQSLHPLKLTTWTRIPANQRCFVRKENVILMTRRGWRIRTSIWRWNQVNPDSRFHH